MNLLELIFGAETMQRVRARTREMQAEQATEVARIRALRDPRALRVRPKVAAAPQAAALASRPSEPAPVPAPPERLGQLARDEARLATLAGDFPTSILETAPVPAPPLLAAFDTRAGLLAAIVFSEALGPPVALR